MLYVMIGTTKMTRPEMKIKLLNTYNLFIYTTTAAALLFIICFRHIIHILHV